MAVWSKLREYVMVDQATDPYISRLFAAFSSDPADKVVTFQDIVECLSFLAEDTPEVHAEWTIRLITGRPDDHFQLPDFAGFVNAIFVLGDARDRMKRNVEKETARQRAFALFKELDGDGDGVVTKRDLVRAFRSIDSRVDTCPV